ncbi:L-gulonolactone oxidase [Rhodopseudomonas rhenobacensis]|uniref:L-gulonolactone oxidase n=1 Tax=Rhodopseudomonas rhenobacensis TaxID=87461 RepID=A0A7W7Z369_9BRAD|nr:L-gulonolactone oxidase [Rhodopseudomonas rhenobacensis]
MTGFAPRTDLLSWGRTPRLPMQVAHPAFRDQLDGLIRAGAAGNHGLLAVGKLRSYGDSCLNGDGSAIEMAGLERFISFDRRTGVLEAEAGVTLAEILRVAIPAGYFLPVTPGTKFVTLGGAIANDVHGKNHHRAGTFGRWVRQFSLARTDGSQQVVGRDDASGLFAATIGGLGLTGVITRVTLELMPIASSRIDLQTIPFGRLSEFFSLAAESEASHDYTVAWIDCLAQGDKLGRGIFTRARPSSDGELRVSNKSGPSVPIDAPGFLLNRLTLSAFNEAYYRIAGRPRQASVSYDPFFYPLDAIGGWNRLYGRRGFYQYQSVVPPAVAEAATTEMLRTIASAGQGSFLAVLKTFGDVPSPGLLSFPMQGTTLALDFANRGRSTLSLLDKLDAIVREAGGRLYPAKDGRLPPAMFRAGYPALNQFTPHMDPGMSSTFWRRMQL